MPYLLLFIILYARARRVASRHRQIASGLGFGLLFYVYFYYWTAAALALAIATVLDAGHRRIAVQFSFDRSMRRNSVAPGQLPHAGVNSADWLLRSDKFMAIGRFSELQSSAAGDSSAGDDRGGCLAFSQGSDPRLVARRIGPRSDEPSDHQRVADREFPLVLRLRAVRVTAARFVPGRLAVPRAAVRCSACWSQPA